MKRTWCSVELGQKPTRKLKRFLRLHDINFETSGCGELTHFEILCDDKEEDAINEYLTENIVLTFFTFGTDEQFPYKDCYIVIEGKSMESCINTFRKFFPDKSKGTVNCAFIYNESEWDRTEMEAHYRNPRLFLSDVTHEWNVKLNYAY